MASQDPFPLMPAKSTELRISHFDEYAYVGDPSTVLYKLVDALCGTSGAGALLNEIFLQRLGGALETIYFNDLDYIFSKVNFLSRSPAESYSYNPMSDQLTSVQWDEVRIKDAWYRERVKTFFVACSLGSTPEGIRMTVKAAVDADADIYESWRYIDNFGLTADLGRSPHSARNEVTIRPHKGSLSPAEMRLLRDMLSKICAVDTIVTVNLDGLAVHGPVPVAAAAADSTYFEVQKVIIATPVLDQLPPVEVVAEWLKLRHSERWLWLARITPQLAPYTAFNITAEWGCYYLVGGGRRSLIDSVTYGTIDSTATEPMDTYHQENNYQMFDTTGQFTARKAWEKADSPDNFPGGQFGIHPRTAPALNTDGTAYTFPYDNQDDYVAARIIEVLGVGGEADAEGYRLPIQSPSSTPRTFLPEYAISFFPPAKDSTVGSSITHRRENVQALPELRDPINFVRTS